MVDEKTVHFYINRSKGFGHEGKLDMQMIDMGIALCHFELSAKEAGLELGFVRSEPEIPDCGMQYIASYEL